MTVKGSAVTLGAAGFIAGALIGVGATLLLAPKSGAETRADMVRIGRKARRRVEDLADDLTDKVDGVVRNAIESGRGVLGKRFSA